ncbi:SCO family protein [Coraliomargarita sinensis]|nr:SCO family protein [Coraliomargarita sinensis]
MQLFTLQKVSRRLLGPLALIGLIVAQVAAGQPVPVSGVLQSFDDKGQAELLLDEGAGTRDVRLSTGDRAYLEAGDRIRGKMVQQPNGYLLETVWPNDPKIEAQMLAINSRLRRDTAVRGRQVYRSIGEDLPPFALYNQFGELIKSSDLLGKTCVINFIFTRCMNPRMCPAATTRMHQLQKKVEEAGLEDVMFISMTLDPEFDTPGIFNAYATGREIDGSNFYFLAGPRQALFDLKKQLGILASRDPEAIIDHTMRTILVDPSGEIIYQVPGSGWGTDDFLNRIKKISTKRDGGK